MNYIEKGDHRLEMKISYQMTFYTMHYNGNKDLSRMFYRPLYGDGLKLLISI